jgi:hypothetical protein
MGYKNAHIKLMTKAGQKYCSEKGSSAHRVLLALYNIGAARRLLMVGALRCLKSRIFHKFSIIRVAPLQISPLPNSFLSHCP